MHPHCNFASLCPGSSSCSTKGGATTTHQGIPTLPSAPMAATVAAASVRPLESRLHFGAHVVKGFQRGSRELGWPTANLQNTAAVQRTLATAECGVYCGWVT